MSFLATYNVSKLYSKQKVLSDISMSVPQGSIYGLLGPNGAGKTTLLRIINRITAPDSGKVMFKGREINADDTANIGYMPEERGLYRKMGTEELIIYLARLKGLSKHDAASRTSYWFNKFEVIPWKHKKIEELSKGMQQKIQFIATVVHEPELLIFDEPFSGFDPINANILKKEFAVLKEKGITIILSTHDMQSVEEMCSHIMLINKSEKMLEGTVDEIKTKHYSGRFILSYSGTPDSLIQFSNTFSIIQTNSKNNIHTSIIETSANNTGTSEMLRMIAEHVEIKSFNQMLPNINDIFIKTVNEENK